MESFAQQLTACSWRETEAGSERPSGSTSGFPRFLPPPPDLATGRQPKRDAEEVLKIGIAETVFADRSRGDVLLRDDLGLLRNAPRATVESRIQPIFD